MVELNDKELRRWKEILAKDGIVYERDEDYSEAVSNLVGYFDILVQIDQGLKIKEQNSTPLNDLGRK